MDQTCLYRTSRSCLIKLTSGEFRGQVNFLNSSRSHVLKTIPEQCLQCSRDHCWKRPLPLGICFCLEGVYFVYNNGSSDDTCQSKIHMSVRTQNVTAEHFPENHTATAPFYFPIMHLGAISSPRFDVHVPRQPENRKKWSQTRPPAFIALWSGFDIYVYWRSTEKGHTAL